MVVGVPIDQTHSLARSPSAARAWLEKHIFPYIKDVKIVNLAVSKPPDQKQPSCVCCESQPASVCSLPVSKQPDEIHAPSSMSLVGLAM